ncbi:MAG: hypothetical protein RDU01_11790 [Thermodesulfovibrionales bacterium]|nr:hypothetical protein [Thermodesulfovibrionales bacterium]
MMSRKIFFFLSVFILVCGMMLLPSQGTAQPGPFCNGDFESGTFDCWNGTGDVGVADFNLLSGYYSAFMTNAPGSDMVLDGLSPQVQLSENPAYRDMCSWIESGLAFPANVPQAVNVSFKVRYKTDEDPWNPGCTDPFEVKLVTNNGSIELVDISTDGITPGPGATVRNMTTNAFVRPPMLPPFICEILPEPGVLQNGLFECETPVYEVRKRLAYTSCEPVSVRFAICDHCDDIVDSAAFFDDVQITFENLPGTLFVSPGIGGGAPIPCPPIEQPTRIKGR